jgi:hypothetical protein
METTPTIDTSATPAKCASRPPPWFSSLTADELDAELDARIDAARCGPAPVRYEPGNDDEEPVAAPAPSRRQRKRTLASTLRAARKAGADRVIVDGVVIVLSPSAAVPESVTVTDSTNEWDAVLSEVDHGPH